MASPCGSKTPYSFRLTYEDSDDEEGKEYRICYCCGGTTKEGQTCPTCHEYLPTPEDLKEQEKVKTKRIAEVQKMCNAMMKDFEQFFRKALTEVPPPELLLELHATFMETYPKYPSEEDARLCFRLIIERKCKNKELFRL